MEVHRMKSKSYVSLALVAASTLVISACGGGGGSSGGGTPIIPVTVSANSPVLVNYSTTVSADFSGKLTDGTKVTFSASPATAALTAQTPVTGGIASVRVKSPVQSNVTVSVSSGAYAGSKLIQFIPQPDKAVVHVALNRNISNLATLSVIVKGDLGSIFTSPTYPVASPATSYAASVIEGTNSFFLSPIGLDVYNWLLLKLGINAVSAKPLMDVTFARDPSATTAGIPVFSVEASLSNPERLSFNRYSSPNFLPTPVPNPLPAVNLATTDYVLTTDYYLGANLLATK